MADNDLNHLITGVWNLVSFEFKRADDLAAPAIAQPMGPNPTGRIHLSTLKYMSAMLTSTESTKPIQSAIWGLASDEEIIRVARPMVSYCGPYRVSREGDELRMSTQVEMSLDPNWIGTDQVRKVELVEEGGKTYMTLRPLQEFALPNGLMAIGVLKWEKAEDSGPRL